MPAATNHSDNETSKSKSKAKSTPVEDNGAESESDGEGEGGSEYEIEEVLDAKRGYFPDVRVIILKLCSFSRLTTRFDAD